MEKICFVIQPFDHGKYDRRYEEIIKPTVEECGLIAYRVDEDCASIIPIESIHMKIRESSICIAEITTDNPNVWYELGYALALEKNVVMLCSEDRTTQFPFDIRHRNILVYKTQTMSDFEELKNKIKNRIKAYLSLNIGGLGNDLSNIEINVLNVIWKNQNTPYEITPKDTIIKDNTDNDDVVNAIRKLISRELIEYVYSNENGRLKSFYRLTLNGELWIKNNGDCLCGDLV